LELIIEFLAAMVDKFKALVRRPRATFCCRVLGFVAARDGRPTDGITLARSALFAAVKVPTLDGDELNGIHQVTPLREDFGTLYSRINSHMKLAEQSIARLRRGLLAEADLSDD
jgi:hypothetical protein